ncbi:restriction endonuclease subunit S, partial [Alkalibacterium kapii]|uniref:restriction endonuclease subunit S n=1 Tax=Alkalibacterium kapii TaxID=426704 RepID=UPI0016498CD9
YYFLDYNYERIRNLSTGAGGRGGLNLKIIGNIKIPTPTLAEQEKIANIITTWDKAIELKQQLIDLKKEQKKGLMQKLLTDRNLLIEPQSYTMKLGDKCSISTGDKNNQDKSKDGEYPFFVRSENIEKINTYSYNGEAILIPGDGRIGQIFHYINGKFDFHQRVYKISDFSRDVSGKYIYYYLNQFFLKHALKFSAKATVDSLRMPMLTDFSINLPSLKKQKKIVEILDVVEKQLELQNIELDLLKQQKKGLMQQLLTGKTRVKV